MTLARLGLQVLQRQNGNKEVIPKNKLALLFSSTKKPTENVELRNDVFSSSHWTSD